MTIRILLCVLFLIGYSQNNEAQVSVSSEHSTDSTPTRHKGKLYAYWGWNGSAYTDADIRFQGQGFDFMLYDAEATDRQTPFALDPYFHPTKITIPQTNFRIGYFFSDHWDISLGFDHMKYVLRQGQTVKIDGSIQVGNATHDGIYQNSDKVITDDFLDFEHTDGLNYINIDVRRNIALYERSVIRINAIAGVGIGALVPRTRTIFLGNYNRDAYQLSGYGSAMILGVQLSLYDGFFIQSEWKGGYIDMPAVRISSIDTEKASHSFWFHQYNFVFGYGYAF